MKTKKSIFKKFIAMSLLLNLALSPTAMVIGNTVYAEKTNTSDNVELPAFCLEGIEKTTGKKITKKITLKVKTHPDYAYWGEEEYLIESVNGVFDFSVVEDKGNLYTVEIEGESDYQLSNIKKDKKDLYILKFDELKKIMRTSNMNGDEVEINSIIFEKKSNNEEEPEIENKEVTIQDIDVVFEDGTAVPDGINFHTFNKENKDMFDYVTSNGKLTGVKAPVSNRMKLGISTDKDKYTLKTDNGYGNYIWFKADKNGIAKYYDEVTAKTSDSEVKKIVVVKKSDLIGEKPQNGKLTKKVLEVFDITSHKAITEDNVKFSVTGGGEVKEFVSKNGKIELELYKNTEYTINIVRAIEYTYKMNGFKFRINDDDSVVTNSNEKVERLNVYQGSYLVRIYVIQGGKHLTKSIDFKIEEIGTDSVQVRRNENNFLNFDASIGKSYRITMKDKDSEYYLEKPIEFTVVKDAEDGLYWPKVAEGDTSQGKDRKVKAVFLKRYDGVGNDIPGLGDNPDSPCPDCPDNSNGVCEVSKTKVKTLPISVNLPEGADRKDVKFKLFNSSKQQYEGEFSLDENGKLPALELYEKNSYFLQLVSFKYFMHNKHFEAVKEGQFPYAFKDKKELKELDVKKNTYNTFNDGTYEIDIKFVKDSKALVNEEIQFISATHTTKATTDELGHLKVRLMEDITYVAKPTNENLIIDTFPIVVKDKTEWGVPGIKYVFDHSSCKNAEIIKVKDKLMGRTDGSLTCKNGNTTLKGMDFKDLYFVTDHFDKSDYSELKDKDVMILDFAILNTVRQNCERTKLAYGEFEILRKLPANKKVISAYYLNGDKKEEFKFEQSGSLLKIKDVHSLGIYPLVIEFEKTGLNFPDNNNEEVKNAWKMINNEWFRFDKDGKMIKNSWFEENGKWYYLESNGVMSKDKWIYVDGDWYYTHSSGRIATNQWVYVDGDWYYAHSSGRIATSQWVYVDGDWYYANSSGRIATSQWVYVDGDWYYAHSSGRIATSQWVYVDGDWYYAHSSGRIATSQWVYVDGDWYYAHSSGRIATSQWVYVDGDWYYANSSGRIATSQWVYVDGSWYYALSSGRIATNQWVYVGGKWYKANSSGRIS